MKKIKNIIFWFLSIIYLEMILKVALFDHAININILYMAVLILPIILMFTILTSLFNKIFNKILSYILVLGVTIIFVAQLVYFKTYLSIFSIFSMGKGAAQITEFADTIFQIILNNIFYISLLLIPLIFFFLFNKYFMTYDQFKFKGTMITLVFLVVFQIIGSSILFLDKSKEYSVHELYYDTHSPTLSTNKLGLLTTMRLDFKRMVTGFKEKSKLNIKPVNNEEKEEDIEYNVMEIDFDKLIETEKDQTIKDMHQYFKSALASSKNKYTGMFKGKNLIFIMGESFNSLAIDKELTPTLYKLYNEGFKFTNFYTPVFPVSTTDGEYIMNTSLIPKEGVWSAYRSSNNYFPYVLGNVFKKLNYKTTAYHDHSATYYERDHYIPNWGYDYYACGRGLKINCKQWPESDLEMIEATYDKYVNNSPFLTYYITVSGHLNYTKAGNSIANKNWSYVKDLNYSEKPKGYLATHIELDKALASLIKHLDEAGVLDNTVIAMGGDHYPYGLTLDEINELAEPDRDDVFEKHHSAFILWNNKMKPKTITKIGSSLDIVPTILNLFGVEFDSRLLMGRDILSDSDPLVIYSNRSWLTDKGRYNSITGVFEPNKGVKVSNQYVSEINQLIYDKFYLSRKILETNYYKKVFPN